MFEMLESLNRFYASDIVASPCEVTFVFDVDGARGHASTGKKIREVQRHLELSAANGLEFVRSTLKSRAPVYRSIRSERVACRGEYFLNFRNGTAVVLGENFADKFYFKDRVFFTQLYKSLVSVGQPVPEDRGEFLFVRRPRYREVERPFRELVQWANPAVERVHGAPVDRSAALDPAAKLEQLFRLQGHPGTEPYLRLVESFAGFCDASKFVLCHGDLWDENILSDQASAPVLIDFDKALRFYSAYDYVYYFLMGEALPAQGSLDALLAELGRNAEAARAFCMSMTLGNFDASGVKACVWLFSCLKLAERDLCRKRAGESLAPLRKAMAELSHG